MDEFVEVFNAHLLELLVRKGLIDKDDAKELLNSVEEYMEKYDLR